MPQDALEIENLCKRFGTVQAVDGLSFAVPRGEIMALLGGTGAGKTTTMAMMLGLVRPCSGTIRFF
ncbi:MAG: ATP-binding cassette domain-containing protein, partial [Alphaproteobacteria bacterium]